jgi:hypothetical protein
MVNLVHAKPVRELATGSEKLPLVQFKALPFMPITSSSPEPVPSTLYP